ncbi:MAG TPA: endonuclease III [Polyangium sp.]|nr:endonuclease III [Polyangium sp.]
MVSPTPNPKSLEIYNRLLKIHPDAHCELEHVDPFQLLVAVVLSAQTTDVLMNQVTPSLFARWPDAQSMSKAAIEDVSQVLRVRLGMYNQKAKHIVGLAKKLVEKHGGQVPKTLEQLVTLPGVGRKTANVVLGVAFGIPSGVVVDTHVQRLSQRLGFTSQTKPEKIEKDLAALFPRDHWVMLAHALIFHGRRVCFAQRPACAACGVNDLCPNAFAAEKVGRKPPRKRKPAVVPIEAVQQAAQKRAAAKKSAPKKTAPTKSARTKTTAKEATKSGSKSTTLAKKPAATKRRGTEASLSRVRPA